MGEGRTFVICGVRGAGKDTSGEYLTDNYGFEPDAFANPIKEMALKAFPLIDPKYFYGPSKYRDMEHKSYPFGRKCVSCGDSCDVVPYIVHVSEYHKSHYRCRSCGSKYPMYLTARLILQSLGTQWGRRLYKSIWVDALFARIDSKDPGLNRDHVVTDCRLLNEIDASRSRGATVIKLTRHVATDDSHLTESEFWRIPDSRFTHIIDNATMTKEELYAAIERIVAEGEP